MTGKTYKCAEVEIILTDSALDDFDSVLVFLSKGCQWVLGYNPIRKGWELPGGHREPGESVLETAQREALEEVGSYIQDVAIKGYYILPNGHKTVFVTACCEGIREKPLHHEIVDVRTFDAFPEDITFKNGVYDFIAELLSANKVLAKTEFIQSGVSHWDSIWDGYDANHYSNAIVRKKIAKHKIALLQRAGVYFAPGEKVLESGCGDATFVLTMASMFHIQPAGVDFSERAIEKALAQAKQQGHDIHCAHSDVRSTPFENHFFDKVISLGIVEHFTSPRLALAENYRILKSKGHMILMTPNKNSFCGLNRKLLTFLNRWPFGYQAEYSPQDLRRMGEEAGFKTVACFRSHRPLLLEDSVDLQAIALLDRLSVIFRPGRGFYSWYIGIKP